MVGHGGSRSSSYLTDPTSPIPSHCALIVVTSTLRVKETADHQIAVFSYLYLSNNHHILVVRMY